MYTYMCVLDMKYSTVFPLLIIRFIFVHPKTHIELPPSLIIIIRCLPRKKDKKRDDGCDREDARIGVLRGGARRRTTFVRRCFSFPTGKKNR